MIRRIAPALLVIVLALASAKPACAQTPADSAGVLLGVAQQLKAEGNQALANSILDLILQRYASTPAAAEAQRLRGEVRTARPEQSGRTELMVFGTTYGLWMGVALPLAASADNPTAYGLGLIAGAPAGFLLSRAYTKHHNLSEGQARAITFGGTWGTWQGFGWSQVLHSTTKCYDFDYCYDDGPSAETTVKSAIVGGLAGIGIGAALAHKNITAGTATTVNFGGLWGTWYGAALVAATGSDNGDNSLRAALIGGDVGIIATAMLAPPWQFSRPRARLISISGVAGLVAGFGVLLITRADNDNSILVPIVTSAAGLGLGAYWTRSMDKDTGRGQGAIDVERKQFGFELPSVQPRVIERIRNGRLERVPAIGLTLFQARF